MPRRTTSLVPGCFFHVYNRGHNCERIFFEEENYAFFLRRFREHVASEVGLVAAYVLMPSHFHFVVKLQTDGFSRAMQNFQISYTKAINTRFRRVGSAFQGAFQAKQVETDEYLLHLSRYLHLNPVSAGMVRMAEEWAYSSYREYVGLREGTLPHPEIVLRQFANDSSIAQLQYRKFVESYQEARDRERIAHLLFGDD